MRELEDFVAGAEGLLAAKPPEPVAWPGPKPNFGSQREGVDGDE